MASVDELLLNTLMNLGTEELEMFQFYLRKDKELFKCEMENADRIKTVEKMVDHFGQEEAVKIMVEILRKIKNNNLANELENKHKQAITPTDKSPPPPQGTSSSNNSPEITPTDTSPPPPQGTSSSNNSPATNIIPSTRNDFLRYFSKFTLDRNTVHKRLCLSESNRVVSYTSKEQSYPDHPDRFDYYPQVLCRESVRGCCYWEIEWSGNGVYISVSYKSISRKGNGDECAIGHNGQSWSLFCSPSRYSFIHNDKWMHIPVVSSRRIGVCVDQSAGTLSFYSISGDAMSLIHPVQTTFTQPLYPGFYVDYKSSVTLVKIN